MSTLRGSGPLEFIVCAAALALCGAVAWIAYSTGPGGYTDHLRAVLLAVAAGAILETITLVWTVLATSRQHRELRRVAIQSATRASRRMSEIVQAQITVAAASLAAGAADLRQIGEQQTRTADIMGAIAEQFGVDVVAPVPPPGHLEHDT